MYYDKERFDNAFKKFLHEFVWSTETLDGFNEFDIKGFEKEMANDEDFKQRFHEMFNGMIDDYVSDIIENKREVRRFHVTNIVWDMTDSQGNSEDEGISLPNEIDLYCFDEDEIADTLSDDYGFCVKSFVVNY